MSYLELGLSCTDPVPGRGGHTHHGWGQHLGRHATDQGHQLVLGSAVWVQDEGGRGLHVPAQQSADVDFDVEGPGMHISPPRSNVSHVRSVFFTQVSLTAGVRWFSEKVMCQGMGYPDLSSSQHSLTVLPDRRRPTVLSPQLMAPSAAKQQCQLSGITSVKLCAVTAAQKRMAAC